MDTRTDRNAKDIHIGNPKSTAKIAGHPVHPMLVPFPIAFFVSTLLADLMFLWTGSTDWVVASVWLLGAGLVTAGLAALAGLTDFIGDHRIRNLNAAWLHAGGNVLAVLLSLWNFYSRYDTGAVAGLTALEVGLSAAVALLLLVTGWLGGEMVYRHRVGISDDR